MIGHLADFRHPAATSATRLLKTRKSSASGIANTRTLPALSQLISRSPLTQARDHDLLTLTAKLKSTACVPVLDALVRNWIDEHLDMKIQRKVIKTEPKMHADVVRHLQRIMKKGAP